MIFLSNLFIIRISEEILFYNNPWAFGRTKKLDHRVSN